MRAYKLFRILLTIAVLLVIVYVFPIPRPTIDRLYQRVAPETSSDLMAFRQQHPLAILEVNGVEWPYMALGQGPETVLFLHGMSGAADIWWQQMEALQDRYRLIAVTYPAVDNLEGLSQGLLAVLEAEGVEQVSVVGTSLGGYLAQYFVAHYPERVERAVFANTFPPNDTIVAQYGALGTLLPYLPGWLIMSVLKGSIDTSLYPASGNSELLRAFLTEQALGAMSKAQFVARYRCVVEAFEPPDVVTLGIPVLIIEADNDPLIEPALRQQLRLTYPTAQVETLHAVGHFAYLNAPDQYLGILEAFLKK